MKKCSACGKEVEEGSFCPECGGKLEDIIENNVSSESSRAFCPNCGTKLNEGAAFCPNCGWSRTGAKNAKGKVNIPKVNMPKIGAPILKIVPVVAVAVVALFAIKFLFFGGLGKDANAIQNSANNTLMAFSKNEVVDIFSNTLSKGSIDIEFSEIPSVSGVNIPVSANGNMKFYFNKNKFAMTFDGNIAGTKCNDNTIYFDKSKVVVKSPSAFGDKVYGLNAKNLENSWLMNSIKNSDPSTYNLIKEAIDKETDINIEAMKKDIVNIYLGFGKAFKNSIKKNLKFKNENDEISIGNINEKVLRVSTSINSEQACKIEKDVLKWAKSDGKIKSFMKKYPTAVQSILAAGKSSLANGNYSGEELYNEFTDMIDKAIEEIDDSTLNDTVFDLHWYISKASKQIVRLALGEKNSSSKLIITGGPDWKNPTAFTIREGEKEIISYVVKKDGNDYTYSVKNYGSDVIRLNWNKKEGDFSLNFENFDSEGYRVTGNMKIGDKSTFIIDRISGGSDWSSIDIKPNVTLTLKKSDGFPSIPGKFNDILTMSESEVQEIAQDALERIGDKFGLNNLF